MLCCVAAPTQELPRDACVVLISMDDAEARVAAKTLNNQGMPFVCAMKGGMKDWRFMVRGGV